ncbi:guanylate cyclase [Desmophyllum pertusum]|uniref:Guanylate cyclase n=1 Tax=Desmophyllum pertusum TaxID=174260 RepID=A0A9X0CN22_9CNID|nr:guanylate cyclase [Desmophyllum pertusum]
MSLKTNIFESMIYMMENYANNLEDIVTVKTGQLREAKRETDELLYKNISKVLHADFGGFDY